MAYFSKVRKEKKRYSISLRERNERKKEKVNGIIIRKHSKKVSCYVVVVVFISGVKFLLSNETKSFFNR